MNSGSAAELPEARIRQESALDRLDAEPLQALEQVDAVKQFVEANFDVVEALEAYGSERGVGLLDVAIGGLAARPAVASVIAGATSAAQVKANALAGGWVPTADDLVALDALLA